jgi:biotin carboxyl carrier protein
MKYVTTIGGREYLIDIIDEHNLTVDGIPYRVDFDSVSGQPVYSLLVDSQSYESFVFLEDEAWQVLIQGTLYSATVEDEREKRLRSASRASIAEQMEFHLKAPMPGLVVMVPVADGQQVNKGDVLLILESMKMQNELKSPRHGTVTRIRVKVGDSVEQKQTLLSVVSESDLAQ